MRLLKEALPCDLCYRLVADTEEWKHRALLQGLDAIRQETAARAKRLNTTLEEQTEGQTVLVTAAAPGGTRSADNKMKAL